MNSLFLQFLKEMQNKGRLKFHENHSLSLVSTLGIGGRARVFVMPYDTDTLCRCVFLAARCGRYKVIGNASNLLFDDCGFDGTVISTVKIKCITHILHPKGESEKEILTLAGKNGAIYSACGTMLPALNCYAMGKGISGFEGLCSVPATVGGALCLNAGAYGSEISDKLIAYGVYDPKINEKKLVFADKSRFSYRKSPIYKSGLVVLCAYFRADTDDISKIKAKTEKNKSLRRENQPQGVKSAGSYFKRPKKGEGRGDFRDKSAGQIIDMCGLKGSSVGGAEVSTKHANFLINASGNAGSGDMLRLAKFVKTVVYKRTGIALREEVEYVPFKGEP